MRAPLGSLGRTGIYAGAVSLPGVCCLAEKPLTKLGRAIQLSKATAIAAAASLAILSSAAQSAAPSPSDPETASVVQLLRAQQYEAAEEAVKRLLTSRPHDCRLLSLDGLALNGLGRSTEAKQSFDRALRYCSHDLLALEGAAQIAYAEKLPDAAELLQRILALRPDDVTTNGMLASIERSRQNCRSALPHFEKSQPLFASHPQLQEGYAWCLAATGSEAEAAKNYQDVLATAPRATARYNLAVVQAKMHDLAASLATLQPLLGTGAEEAPLQLGSQLAEEAGDTPQAVQLLRRAILRDPKDAENYLRFAQLSFAHNSAQVGIDILNAGLTQLPDAAPLYVARGVLEAQISKFDEGLADFEKAHELEPQLSLALDAIGITQSQQHNAEGSLRLFREQARQHPDDGLLQYLYAEALSQDESGSGSLPQAIEAAEQSVRVDPGYVPARDLLALLYVRINQPQKAVAQAEAALRIEPDDQTALYQEIMARRALGQTAEAQKLAQQLADLRRKSAVQDAQKRGYVLRDEIRP